MKLHSFFCGLAALVITGCGNSGSGVPSDKPFPPEFRVLGEHLTLSMKSSPDQFHDDKDMAEIIAEGHSAILALRGVKSTDPEINYVAEHGASSCAEAVLRVERINALPKPPSDLEVFATSFLAGAMTGDPFSGMVAGGAIGANADEKRNAILAEIDGLCSAMDKLDAVQMLLPKIAEKYAATLSQPTDRIRLDIDEAWGPYGPNDWFYIYNAGPELEDCTIQVQLHGATGQSRKNVHFVQKWPANSWMYARYEPGTEFNGKNPARMTVKGIQKAEVLLLSPKYSTSLSYVYSGAEKDKDIAKWCKDITLIGRYRRFAKGLVWDTERGATLTLDGINFLPRCHVDVQFRRGSAWKGWGWDFDSWSKGETKTFGTSKGELDFDPDQVTFQISFPETSYRHKGSLRVSN